MNPLKNTQSRVTTTKLCCTYLILTLVSTLFVTAEKTDTKMTDFVGTYKFEKDDGHFDDFLRALGKFHSFEAALFRVDRSVASWLGMKQWIKTNQMFPINSLKTINFI